MRTTPALLLLLLFYTLGCSRSIPESELPKAVENSLGMKFVLIPSGSFTMGTPETEATRNVDEKQHQVVISKAYYLGVYEVTRAQFSKVMGKDPSGPVAEGTSPEEAAALPVDSLKWSDAIDFCRELSRLPEERKAGRRYRMPTEAEWEYACRAGTTTAFSFGDDPALLDEYAWYEGNSDQHSHAVGQKKPNAWGLYDMHGNMSELCQDWYVKELVDAKDPLGPLEGEYRCRRGGAWYFGPEHCRSGARDSWVTDGAPSIHGLRVILQP